MIATIRARATLIDGKESFFVSATIPYTIPARKGPNAQLRGGRGNAAHFCFSVYRKPQSQLPLWLGRVLDKTYAKWSNSTL